MDDHIKKYLLASVLFMVLPQSLMAAPLWSDVSVVDKSTMDTTAISVQAKALNSNPHINSRRVSVDYNQLKATLTSANTLPAGLAKKTLTTTQIDLPMPYGGLQTFNVVESSVMAPELATKYPQIKTYKVAAANDPTIKGVVDIGPNGFHAYLNTAKGEMFINPVSASTQQEYYSLYKHDYASTSSRKFSCGVKSKSPTASPVEEFLAKGMASLARTSGNKITYRIAVAATGEYSQAVKASPSLDVKAEALAQVVQAIASVSFIYERDLAIKLELVANNDLIIYTDAANDPYTDQTDASQLLTENQINLDDVLGSSNYDIGHVFSTGGGSLAALGVVCITNYKAKGETGLPVPLGDVFYIDFVAHEIGHQLGANHSFNGTSGSCGNGNRNAATAFEPGSGSTVMAYAGICSPENTTTASIATFHAGSTAEIYDYTRLGGGSICPPGSAAGSVAPTVVAGSNYTIPGGTAFTLTGSAIDPESDVMTYQWDQMDIGTATTSTTHGTDNGSNALFRSYLPVATAERTFPTLSTLLGNNPDILAAKAETLPTENRTLNFRLTARDGNGGVGEDDMKVVVNGKAGPFELLQPTTSVILKSTLSQSIQWNAACTNATPINCANVDILLSTDGGQNFDTVLLASTPNSGIASVTIPAGNTTTTARIKVACSDNIFFDISNVDFEINDATGGTLPTGLSGGSYDCGTATIPPPPPSSGGVFSAYWLFMLIMTPLLRHRRKV